MMGIKEGKNVGIYTKKGRFRVGKKILVVVNHKWKSILNDDLTHMIPLLFTQGYDLQLFRS